MDQINIGTSTGGIGARLREGRMSKNYSLEHLAIATGLTEAEIAAVEDGTSHDPQHVERIEHALG